MFEDFMIRALLAGCAAAIAAGPLGCFVVWRRMAYFGDATSHAAIFGVALSFAFSMSSFYGVLVSTMIMAMVVGTLSQRHMASDTILGVLAHSALAIGLVMTALVSGSRIDLNAYLFGDILAVSWSDVLIVALSSFAVLLALWARWSALLLSTICEDLSFASGIVPRREQIVLTLGLAMLIAVSIKIVGALLIVALLIIPAAASRQLAKSPEQMAFAAAGIGAISVMAGLAGSYEFDTPSGPSIVTAAAILFAILTAWAGIARAK